MVSLLYLIGQVPPSLFFLKFFLVIPGHLLFQMNLKTNSPIRKGNTTEILMRNALNLLTN